MIEDVQSVLVKYGFEVGTWEDVPQAVEQLACKQGKEPLPEGELGSSQGGDDYMVYVDVVFRAKLK